MRRPCFADDRFELSSTHGVAIALATIQHSDGVGAGLCFATDALVSRRRLGRSLGARSTRPRLALVRYGLVATALVRIGAALMPNACGDLYADRRFR
jgi:hypothetical protein